MIENFFYFFLFSELYFSMFFYLDTFYPFNPGQRNFSNVIGLFSKIISIPIATSFQITFGTQLIFFLFQKITHYYTLIYSAFRIICKKNSFNLGKKKKSTILILFFFVSIVSIH